MAKGVNRRHGTSQRPALCYHSERGRSVGSLILGSILVVTFALPARAARDVHPRRGMRRVAMALVAFTILYYAALVLVYAPFYAPERW